MYPYGTRGYVPSRYKASNPRTSSSRGVTDGLVAVAEQPRKSPLVKMRSPRSAAQDERAHLVFLGRAHSIKAKITEGAEQTVSRRRVEPVGASAKFDEQIKDALRHLAPALHARTCRSAS